MNFNNRMLNLWIGLCRGDHGLPKDIRNLGYRDVGVEWVFTNHENDRVCPDLLMTSEQTRHTILNEIKSGANLVPDQLRRYAAVTRDDLVGRAQVPATVAERHDVLIMADSQHEERVAMGLGEYEFPVVLAEEDGLRLGRNEFSVGELNQLFNPRFKIDMSKLPTSWVPFDHESPQWEVAETVVPVIIEAMAVLDPSITVHAICARSCKVWDIMGPEPRTQIRRKVRDLVSSAARSEFSAFWEFAGERLTFHDNPLELGVDRRTAPFRRLKVMQTELITRLRYEGQTGELFP